MKRIHVVGGYVVYNKCVLLALHNKLHRWVPVGGVVDENELPETAVVREIKEETGLDAILYTANQLVGFDNYACPLCPPFRMQLLKINDDLEYIDYVYFCRANTDVLNIQEDELDDLKWFTREDLQNFPLAPHVKYLGEMAIDCFENSKLQVYNNLVGN